MKPISPSIKSLAVVAALALFLGMTATAQPAPILSVDLTRLSKNLFGRVHVFHHSRSIWLCPLWIVWMK